MKTKYFLTGMVLVVCAFVLLSGVQAAAAPVWTPVGTSGQGWFGIAMSHDGVIQTAIAGGGHIYTSTDSGATWTARDSKRQWYGVAMSADGTKQTAVESGGKIYISSDSGVTWTSKASNAAWTGVAMSSDGTKQTAVAFSGHVYISADSGSTWTSKDSSRDWTSVAMSDDGTRQTAVANGGHIYVSTDSGNTWTSKDSSRDWFPVAMSSDGMYQVAAVDSGQIYESHDYGSTWTATAFKKAWVGLAMSADGMKQIAGTADSTVYVSNDRGTTWTSTGLQSAVYHGAAMSDDATKQAVTQSGGYIFELVANAPSVTTAAPGSMENNLEAGGTVTDDGGLPTTYGVCYGTAPDPDLSGLHTVDGTGGNGSFTTSIGMIVPGSPYHVRAYATNTLGTAYGADQFVYTQTDQTWRVVWGSWNDQYCIAMSADGAYQSCGSGYGVFVSDNYGRTWHHPAAGISNDLMIMDIAMSSSGQYQTALAYHDKVYTSSDYGEHWTQQFSDANRYWVGVAMSSNGALQTAVENDTEGGSGELYVSIDFGNTWNQKSNTKLWSSVAMTADGTLQMATAASDGTWVSSDSGSTWTAAAGLPASNNEFIAVSSDGSTRMLTSSGVPVYVSTDSGTTWHTASGLSGYWGFISMSGNGRVQFAGADRTGYSPGQLFASYDYGAHWVQTQGADHWFSDAASTPDGNRFTAVAEDKCYGIPCEAVVTTDDATHVSAFSAVSGGDVTDGGGDAVTARGVCWSTSPTPDITDSHTADGTGSGTFSSDITGLSPGQSYHVRAYATNGLGTTYGEDKTFSTTIIPPTVTTTAVSGITTTTADSGGNVTAGGGATVTGRGVCWSLDDDPTIADAHTSDGSGMGVFASGITGMNPGTPYHLRAYATNSSGTGYGDDIEFSTLSTAPALTTVDPTAITTDGASSGGDITDPGSAGANITARGVCWSTSPNPTLTDPHTSDGTGMGAFTSTIAGLDHGATYHVRAYATNDASPTPLTGYGDDEVFTTVSLCPWYPVAFNGGWFSIAMSSDGVKRTAADYEGNLYTSSDSGLNWTARDQQRGWNGVAMSADGTKQTAVDNGVYSDGGGQIYTSSDSGASWTPRDSQRQWVSVAMSADGTTQTALDNGPFDGSGGLLYTSYDSGATWTPRGTDKYWCSVSMSSDGIKQAAVDIFDVYLSTDSGATWNPVPRDPKLTPWQAVAMSADGKRITATCLGGQVYVSPDFGATWNPVLPVHDWYGIAVSHDGKVQTAVADGSQIYVSLDYGVTWTPTDSSRRWNSIAMSSNGSQQSAGAMGDKIYIYPGVPIVTTDDVTGATGTTAECGGNITDSGGGAVTARGVCWGTSANPTISNSHTTDGTGPGAFTSSITGLTPGVNYHARAYATRDGVVTGYGADKTFRAIEPPSVDTSPATDITSRTATTGGNVTDDGGDPVTARGVCWSVNPDPNIVFNDHTTDGSGTGSFTSSLTGLYPGVTYHIRAYATNGIGTSYGSDLTFKTVGKPSVTTADVSDIATDSATCGGDVTSDGGDTVTARGVCWNVNPNPTITGMHTEDGTGTGAFTSSITGLEPGGTYYVRAYATNSVGTKYGTEKVFTTLAPPTVTTADVTNITISTATSGGEVTADGGAAVTARGVCWSRTPNPYVSGDHTTDGSGTGTFISSLADLLPGKQYYVRAYATNSAGTSYGDNKVFTTLTTTPSLTTTSITAITTTGASSGGNVTSDGGDAVTARGVCWSTSADPTTADNHTTDGSGTGTFTSSISGLSPGAHYHVRAYATNGIGTSYGGDLQFTTLPTTPALTTTAPSGVTAFAAGSGGNVTGDGGATVSARGVCWSTSPDPTTGDSHTTDGTGTGTFTSSITGLTPATQYHVRAYATNTAGTAYGADLPFTTLATTPSVTTTAITAITTTGASSGGNVTSDGGDAVSARGVCWSTSANPTTAGSHTTNGTGSGAFASSITGLTAGTQYHVRAYATNTAGTAYGADVPFTTQSDKPVINSVSPAFGPPGTTVTIKGSNFGTGPGSGTGSAEASASCVTFNGVKSSEYPQWTATQIQAVVPEGATVGPVCVITSSGSSNTDKKFTVVSPTWYLAEGSTDWGFSAYVSVINPNSSPVHVTLTYMPTSGANQSQTITMVPNSRATVYPKDLIGAKDFSTVVTCIEGLTIAADRTMEWTGPGATTPEDTGSIGVTAPAKTWFLPEGSTKWGFECWLLVQNPNSSDTTATFTYMIEGGTPKTVQHPVKAHSRATFNMADDIGAQDASVEISAPLPVIPERSMYRNNRREGADSIGTTTPATDYFLAEGATGYNVGYTTYVLVQNPNASAANVSLTYMTQGGKVAGPSFKMDPNSRKTVCVNDQIGPNNDVSTQVHGDKPIIAERSMYWNNGTGEACHDSIGMDAPHGIFYLPDGQAGSDVETWTLVQNPNSTAVSVNVTYLGQDGSVKTVSASIPANSRKTFNMADAGVSGMNSVQVSCQTAGKKIMVERSMYWNNRGAGTDTIGGFED
jgi:hypothetical protein